MPDLIIGCPVLRREWIAREWIAAIAKAVDGAARDPIILVVGDQNDPTMDVLDGACRQYGIPFQMVAVHEPRCQDQRMWGVPGMYDRMCVLRNTLLAEVRRQAPYEFLSLDSDILLHPEALWHLEAELIGHPEWAAIGGKVYLEPQKCGTACPSWARLNRENGLSRVDADGVFPSEIIMAVKLMTAAAYQVDYSYHLQGEDIGWSLNCKTAGLQLGWDGTFCSKHVMDPAELHTIDERVGY